MKAAGLTHGGFYRHFACRDDLITGALDRAFDDARVDLFEELKPDSKGSLLPRLCRRVLEHSAQR